MQIFTNESEALQRMNDEEWVEIYLIDAETEVVTYGTKISLLAFKKMSDLKNQKPKKPEKRGLAEASDSFQNQTNQKNFFWAISGFDSSSLTIKVAFDDQTKVSLYEPDNLVVNFTKPQLFIIDEES